jgi:hypothetical protein
MCDFSLHAASSRPAKVGDKLRTHNFNTGTTGFTAQDDTVPGLQATAVCVLPGTELAFDDDIHMANGVVVPHRTAIFRQLNKEFERMHHDALEFADGARLLLTNLRPGQKATVLQLPAAPRNEAEAQEQRRAEYV